MIREKLLYSPVFRAKGEKISSQTEGEKISSQQGAKV